MTYAVEAVVDARTKKTLTFYEAVTRGIIAKVFIILYIIVHTSFNSWNVYPARHYIAAVFHS